MMESPTYHTIGPAVPAMDCGLCLKYPLLLLRDGQTTVCEYCDSPGNPMPPVGGFPDDEEDEVEEYYAYPPEEEG